MIKSIKTIPVVLLALVSLMTSCIKKDDYDTDTPSTNVDPDLTANIEFDSLLTLAVNGVNPTYINDDLICVGVVAADDKSGNFYKEIVLQDNTAGISVLLDQSDYYTVYPIGRRIFIKLKGLYIAAVDGNIKIGSIENGALSRIPNTSITSHFYPGKWNLEVTAKKKKLSQITSADINMLVEFYTVQFQSADIGKTFADAVTQTDVSRYLQDCGTGTMIIRTSGFANFASSVIPCKGGRVRGVVQFYGSTAQVFLRSTDDLDMNIDRCGTITVPFDTINENFTGIAANIAVSDTGWVSITITGDKSWLGKSSGGNFYPEATAYQASGAIETWLVSPPFDLASADTLTFESAQSFWVQDGLSVWFSQNFDVCNPSAATWVPLTCNLATGTSGNNTFVPSGIVPLNTFTGTGFIGFKYVGNGATGQTSNYRVDNVMIH